MAGTDEVQSKVWSVFFRHAKMGMLMLNLGSKLVAVLVICLLVATTRKSSPEEVQELGVDSGSNFQSRRALREIASVQVCPVDFSQTEFPMTLAFCTLPNVWSESCCAAIKSDFWVPAFGDDVTEIPPECVPAVESRLLQEQISLRYSAVCTTDSDVLSDPLMRRGQKSDVRIQTAPQGKESPRFETVVSQLAYSEESVEEIPADTRPEEEGGVGEGESSVLRRGEVVSRIRGGTEIQPFDLRRKGKAGFDFEALEPLALKNVEGHVAALSR